MSRILLLSIDEFIQQLCQLKQEARAFIETITYPPLLKYSRVDGSPCPWKKLKHIASREVIFGQIYQEAVNERRIIESLAPNFVPLELWGGAGAYDTKFTARHIYTGQRYLVWRPATTSENQPKKYTDIYFAGQRKIPADQIYPFRRITLGSQRQGLKRPVLWQTLKIENLRGATLCGARIKISPPSY